MFRKPDGAGKGDAPRPTDWDKFSNNFDAIFGKKPNDRKPMEEVPRCVDSEEHPPEDTK